MVARHGDASRDRDLAFTFSAVRGGEPGGFSNALGGLGGDELNAGEYEYFFYYFAVSARAVKRRPRPRKSDRLGPAPRPSDLPEGPCGCGRSPCKERRSPVQEGIILGADRARMTRYFPGHFPRLFRSREFRTGYGLTRLNSYLRNRTYQDMFREPRRVVCARKTAIAQLRTDSLLIRSSTTG